MLHWTAFALDNHRSCDGGAPLCMRVKHVSLDTHRVLPAFIDLIAACAQATELRLSKWAIRERISSR